MSKRILALILCISLILTACTKKENKEVNQPVKVEKLYDENKYELTALKSSKQGIDNSSGFQLVSKDNISLNYVKDNLHIIPEEEIKIEEVSNTVYNIIPLNRLANDKIYQVKLNDEPYEYSWAFQTKKEFKIESTIPANDSNYVPAHSGIEVYFSLTDFEDIDEYFEIKPETKGRFIRNNNSIIFAPEKLENNTRYTVTIKKGFGLNDDSERLKEDYVFSFTTETDENAKIYFDDPLINITESNTKVMAAYINSQYNDSEFTINIYQYKTDDDFANDINTLAETGKYPEKIKENSNLVNINTINQKPYTDEEYSFRPKAIFELPDELKKGYYLLEFSVEDISSYLFMQINDMLMYNTIFEEQIFVFAGDGATSKGIKNANVFLNDEKIGATDENGLLTVNKKVDDYKTVFMRIEADGYNDFIYADSNLFKYFYYRGIGEEAKYFRYLDTDRPVYMPTDTIYVWGFARHRYEGAVNKVKIKLKETMTGLIIDSKEVKLTDIGTYETKFEINNMSSGGLRIEVYDNDLQISSEYVQIRKYTKPLYTLSGELSKKIMYSGDDLSYKINANFFDGNPVPNLSLKLNSHCYRNYGYEQYNNMNEEVKLNEKGEKIVNINTVVQSNSWRPLGIDLNIYNNEAEDTAVNLHDSFSVFPKNKMLEVERNSDNTETFDILLHELVIKDFNLGYLDDFASLRGKTLDDVVNVEIIETYYEKVKIGEYYDFINKVNQITYDYNKIENIVYQEYINTVSGIANVQIPNFDINRSYRIIATYYDEVNGTIQEEAYINGRYRPYGWLDYRLEDVDNKEEYRLNESVSMELTYDNTVVDDVDNDNLILLFARNGLVDYMNFNNTKIQFPFKEDYIPRVSILGVYIKNGYMYSVDGVIYYDKTERQMYFDVTSNKEDYKPSEEVTLSIHTYDENNNPCIADVNISVVDEAYFAVFEKNVNTLNDLYDTFRFSWYTGVIKSYLSNVDIYATGPGMAEMGGGGGNDNVFRDDFDDTAAFKTVTTDKNGKATMKFKLPDNLTSWRITYQGVSDSLYAGSGTKNITVSLPFFVDLIMGSEYLNEDNINVSLRTFGTAAVAGDEADYKITVVNKETGKKSDINSKGLIGDYTNISLGKLNDGNYEIYVTASSNSNKDAIKEEFSVVESYIYFNNTDYYKICDSTVLEEVYSNPVITLFNESRSDFYNCLQTISNGGGRRIDQTVLSMIARKYINEHFKTDLDFSEEELLNTISEYEAENGKGYKLFPYSEGDMRVTAKLANLVDDENLNSKFKYYFKLCLENNTDYNTAISASLWGLGKYKEPVLLKIYDLLENNSDSLENRDKIYLSLALAELGDKKTANKYYKEFIDGSLKSGDYLYYDNKQNDTDNYELTALLSILGVKLQNFETSDKLFKYIYNKPSKMTLSNFEQLIYIMNRDIMKLDEIKDLFGETTVVIDGEKKNYKLKLFDRESFAITKDKVNKVKFNNIKGSIACKVEALGNKDDLDKNRTEDISIKVSYTLKGTTSVQNKYNQSDIATVTITPSFASKIERGNYEVTYIIPSGFRYIKSGSDNYWSYIDGQKLKFNYHYDRDIPVRPIIFTMQAAQKGEYTVDYAVIKEDMEAKLNYMDRTTLTIN